MRAAIIFGLPWLLSAITIWMTILAGNKHRWAWAIGLGNQALWLVWIIASSAWGLLPMNVALAGARTARRAFVDGPRPQEGNRPSPRRPGPHRWGGRVMGYDLGLARSRRTSSASMASRMNCARPYLPQSASIRSSASGGKRTGVGLLPSGGRPIRGAVVDTDKSGKAIENDTVFVDVLNDVVYIDDTVYGGKAMKTADRETIARIIDPQTWRGLDHALAEGLWADGGAAVREAHRPFLKPSLCTADAIIALDADR